MTTTASALPVLESGDHLSRGQFHRLYSFRPDIKKAELVEGVVYVASPVRANLHAEPHATIVGWLGVYRARHPGLHLGDNATLFLDERNEVQPDARLWLEEHGGPRIVEHYIEGAPQLIVEIVASSASYDLHQKLEAYRRNGVHEYIVWRVLDHMVDWFCLRDGEYVWVEPDEGGVIESEAFPGLCLHMPKLLADDIQGVLDEMERRARLRAQESGA